MYDDDDEEEEDETADPKTADTYDPTANLKEAFTLGQAALKLFFFEENADDKFEVLQARILVFYISFTGLSCMMIIHF